MWLDYIAMWEELLSIHLIGWPGVTTRRDSCNSNAGRGLPCPDLIIMAQVTIYLRAAYFTG